MNKSINEYYLVAGHQFSYVNYDVNVPDDFLLVIVKYYNYRSYYGLHCIQSLLKM
jgi:hypothetical protein